MTKIRPVERIRAFCDAVEPEYVTTIVDVGANPFAGTPPYGVLRRSDRSNVIGFEPQEEALASLKERARWNDTFLPYAIGDGNDCKLFVTRNSGLVSTLKPQAEIGDLLGGWWKKAISIKDLVPIKTKKLDEVEEVRRIDFLKIDIQGGELNVFRGARQVLEQCAVIQTEVCLHPYYENQPSFGDVNAELVSQGFILHKFVEMSAHPLSFNRELSASKVPPSQATVADVIFIKNVTDMSKLSEELIKQMAILSMSVFHSYDLCLRCLSELQIRGVLSNENATAAVKALPI